MDYKDRVGARRTESEHKPKMRHEWREMQRGGDIDEEETRDPSE
jgi:hypothetical protein